jgi:hypothetical protein
MVDAAALGVGMQVQTPATQVSGAAHTVPVPQLVPQLSA